MNNYWGVVPAAGHGERFGGDIPKQYIRIAGATVIEHSLSALLRNDHLRKVMVSLTDGDEFWPQTLCNNHPQIIECRGGATRALSVMAGLEALCRIAAPNDWVVVHDAVRPCFTDLDLSRLIAATREDDIGGLLVAPLNDTAKYLQDRSSPVEVERTLERERVVRALTPQIFRLGLLLDSIGSVLDRGIEILDEAHAVELSGHRVQVVAGGGYNVKLTYPYEIPLIESWLNTACIQEGQDDG